MSIMKWYPIPDPFEDLEQFFSLARPSAPTKGPFPPAVDIYQTNGEVMVEIPLAGVDPDKVDISIRDNVLSVKGTMEKKTEVEDKNYIRREVRSGSFARTIPLPVAVVGDQASAISENGMLKISVPKVQPAKAKKVEVKIQKS